MGSKHLGADLNVAWPTAQIAVMGAQGAANIVHRKTLAAVEAEGGDVEARRAELVDEYETTLANPYIAAERGYVDTVIMPHETRTEIVRGLRLLRSKDRKSVVEGKSVSVRVAPGGRRIIKKTNNTNNTKP